jgi:hypothetical protein
MKPALPVFAALLVATPPAFGAPDDADRALGHMLTLVQSVVRIAARSETPQESFRAFDEILAGRNAEVNRAVLGLFDEMTADMSSRNRDRMAAIGRDLAMLGRRDLQRDLTRRPPSIDPLQARKDLNAMGLSYFDQKQFFDAAQRGDALAVELYIAGRGVDLAGRGADGRDAAEIARDHGHTALAERLARSLPAAR